VDKGDSEKKKKKQTEKYKQKMITGESGNKKKKARLKR
jgi:hypothetical protein